MDTNARINQIDQARTHDELRKAMQGFYDEVIRDHPELAKYTGFRGCLEEGIYGHALIDIEGDENVEAIETLQDREYPEVKHVLREATVKHVLLG